MIELLKQVVAGELTADEAAQHQELIDHGVVVQVSKTVSKPVREGVSFAGPGARKSVEIQVWQIDQAKAKELLAPLVEAEERKNLKDQKRKDRVVQNEVDLEIPPVNPHIHRSWQQRTFGMPLYRLIGIVVSVLILLIAFTTFILNFVF